MLVNNEKVIPFLIHENCLYVFDLKSTLEAIAYDLSISLESLSSVRIYAFNGVTYYNQITGNLEQRRYDNPTLFAYLQKFLNLWYAVAHKRLTYAKVVIVADKDDPIQKKKLHELSAHVWESARRPYMTPEPRPKIIGIYSGYDWGTTYYNEHLFNRHKHATVSVSFYHNTMQILIRLRDFVGLQSSRHLPLICPHYNRRLLEGMPVVTVEDYSKWYDLYIITKDGECTESWKYKLDANHSFGENIDWIDHAPNPASVVDTCKKYDLYLDFLSYVAICYRWSEDIFNDEYPCEGYCNTSDVVLPDIKDLMEVLRFDPYSMCCTFGLPWFLNNQITNLIFPGTKNHWNMIRKEFKFYKYEGECVYE